MEAGRLIVFEGIDGAGKTTHIALLADWLRAQGRQVVTTAEPTGGETGRMLRRALSGTVSSRSNAERRLMNACWSVLNVVLICSSGL